MSSNPITHPAFPSLPPPSASSSSSSNDPPPIPTTAVQVRNLIKSYNSPSDIRDLLIPTLERISQGEGQASIKNSSKERVKKGEEILSLGDDAHLMRLDDNEIHNMTAGLVYAVSSRLNRTRRAMTAAHEESFNLAVRLCAFGDPQQLQWCAARASVMAWGMLRLAQEFDRLETVLEPLSLLLNALYIPGRFSGVEAVWLEATLLRRDFETLPSIPDLQFVDVAPNTAYVDVLTYNHHAGLICASKREFARAKEYFTAAVTSPAQAASAIQLASAKRAILCELLHSGRSIDFPKYTSPAVNRVIERSAGDYLKLAKAYEAQDWSAVKEIAKKGGFNVDNNIGLLEQVLGSITKRRILKVQDSYSRVTLGDLITKVGLADDAGLVLVLSNMSEMIESKAIYATITPPTNPTISSIVTFSDPPTEYISKEIIQQIHEANALAAWLERGLVRGNREKGISKEWLKKQASLAESNARSGKKGEDLDVLMAAEEFVDRGGTGIRGVGGNHADTGF